jgi:signal transduction histidine kinase
MAAMSRAGRPLAGARAAAAHERSAARDAGAGELLGPVALTVGAVVLLSVATTRPQPALDGRGLALLAAVVAWAGCLLAIARPGRPRRADVVLALMAAAAVALAALQPHGPASIAGSVPVFVAFLWLDRAIAGALAVATAAGLVVAHVVAAHAPLPDVVETLVLLVLMAATATLMRRARDDQTQTELLYAQLEDVRDAQAESAALAERTRIAGELHDVLAHSLSGAAIQLQGARRILAGAGVGGAAAQAVDRAAELVRDGLGDARRAVGALRGEALPTIAQLPALVAQLAGDLHVDVAFEGGEAARPVSPPAGVALYRATQEAVTNAARHAPGARVTVRLEQDAAQTTLTIDDDGRADGRPAPEGANGDAPGHDDRDGSRGGGPGLDERDGSRGGEAGLEHAGGGHGLESMRERAGQAGVRCEAGPREDGGWRVRLEVPA